MNATSLRVVTGSVIRFLLLLSSLGGSIVRADLIAADDFECDPGLSRDCNDGTGWADAWTGANSITAGSLSFRDYDAKGNKFTATGAGSNASRCSFRTPATTGHRHLLADDKFGKPGTTLWIAFLANVPNGVNSGFGGLSLIDERREELFLGDSGASTMWGFERSGQLQRFSKVRADQRVTFLVYKIGFRSGGAQIEMWVNPSPGANDPPAADVVAAEMVREFRFTRVRICSAPAAFNLDGLRIGTTYADVAPIAKKL